MLKSTLYDGARQKTKSDQVCKHFSVKNVRRFSSTKAPQFFGKLWQCILFTVHLKNFQHGYRIYPIYSDGLK